MTDAELQAIRDRCEAASPGAWDQIEESGAETANGQRFCLSAATGLPVAYCYGSNSYHNIRFIAHVREDIPALLAEVDRLRKQNAAYQERWPNLTHQQRDRLVAVVQEVGVSVHGKWLSEAAIEAIEGLRAELSSHRPVGRDCPDCGRPLVRIEYAAASACPECLCRERDEEMAEIKKLQGIIADLAARVVGQSELLTKRAEKCNQAQ